MSLNNERIQVAENMPFITDTHENKNIPNRESKNVLRSFIVPKLQIILANSSKPEDCC